MYTAKNLDTGEFITMTEEQARAEITRGLQCDMGTFFEFESEYGEDADAKIAETVAENMDAYFEEGTFQTDTYEITRAK